MKRVARPPADFECLYRHRCPYLDGLSTQWVYEEYRHLEQVYQEHLHIIDDLLDCLKDREEQIRLLERDKAELKAKLTALHRRQFKSNRGKEPEPFGGSGEQRVSEDPPRKKQGAPLGHPGWTRPTPTQVHRTVSVAAPTRCPHCQSRDVTPTQQWHEHLQEDIILKPETVVTCFRHQLAFCAHCQRSVFQAGGGEMPQAPIGPVAKSTALYLRYQMGLSYRKVSTLFRDLFGLNFVPASAVGFDRCATQRGTPLYADLRQKIRAAAVVHADETSWRSQGVGHYVWFAGNEELAFFHIDRHRSHDVATAIFGENFPGILVRDRYAAYNGIGVEWQSCWAHILTKAKEISQQHASLPEVQQEAAVPSFLDQVRQLGSQVCEVGQQLKIGDILWKQAATLEKQFSKRLHNICQRALGFGPAETFRTSLVGPEQQFLFTFLRHAGVPPTNNHAEQSLRHLVIFRKICFGTRSPSGLQTHSILPSLVQTARRQRGSPREFLYILLTQNTATAQAALFNSS
jgi:transposase